VVSAADKLDRLLALAGVAAAINAALRFVPADRRDDFEAATGQLLGVLSGLSAAESHALTVRVRAEEDAKADARRAGQS